ncbi:RNA 2',3'-cyclic phosphodiesterase [Oceanobacillus sp. FSL K6-0127]|uniref:RNA 2',3'-cyclic phosphodiesterase n=1 Tax=Oceanobacillus sp. FSL K6-0127 TaxID=2921420 RepID=UPI0030EE4B54
MAHYFIAIQLPKRLQAYFTSWQNELQKKLVYKQWTHQKDLHITLQFLGEVDDNRIRHLTKALEEIERISSFDIEVGGVGVFGNPNKPRVLWAGVNKTNALAQLQRYVESCTMTVGFPKETRAYTPHITLAKKWDGTDNLGKDTLKDLKNTWNETWSITVAEIVLIRIHPKQTPKYEVVKRYCLQ